MVDSQGTPVDWEAVRHKTIDMLVQERRDIEAIKEDLLTALGDCLTSMESHAFETGANARRRLRCINGTAGDAIAKAEGADNGK